MSDVAGVIMSSGIAILLVGVGFWFGRLFPKLILMGRTDDINAVRKALASAAKLSDSCADTTNEANNLERQLHDLELKLASALGRRVEYLQAQEEEQSNGDHGRPSF